MSAAPLKLGVNIDHVATLRQARYRDQPDGEPDPVAAALVCEAAGAHGITAHLREDRRHILNRDVRALRSAIGTRLNLEMANVPSIIEIALDVKPDIVCVVPERREEVTTEGGLDVLGHEAGLRETCARFRAAGIDVSLFVAPDADQIAAAARVGAQYVELHTGQFAHAFADPSARAREVGRLIASAEAAHAAGLRVNAGHGLNYENLGAIRQVPHLVELNIGHSIVSRAVFTGLHAAVTDMLALLR